MVKTPSLWLPTLDVAESERGLLVPPVQVIALDGSGVNSFQTVGQSQFPKGIDSARLKQLAHDAIGFFEASFDEKNAATLAREGGGDGTACDAGASHNCVVA